MIGRQRGLAASLLVAAALALTAGSRRCVACHLTGGACGVGGSGNSGGRRVAGGVGNLLRRRLGLVVVADLFRLVGDGVGGARDGALCGVADVFAGLRHRVARFLAAWFAESAA